MHTSCFFACCLFSVLESFSQQDTAFLNVISAGGIQGETSTLKVSSTVGETVVSTFRDTRNTMILTQGFHQEIVKDRISFLLSKTKELCIGRSNGTARIDSIEGCEGPYTILWSNGDVGNFADNLTKGVYSVQVTSANGCTKVFEFTIEIENDFACLLKFYSGITPNNDGLNDKWIIDNLELYSDNEVVIFNRVGSKVWEANNYDNITTVWGGENLNGEELPSGTYFYIFESKIVEKGWIELTR